MKIEPMMLTKIIKSSISSRPNIRQRNMLKGKEVRIGRYLATE
ncbi:MAG: hypothetical protein QXX95_03335 [Nitrososphaerales archaeon]